MIVLAPLFFLVAKEYHLATKRHKSVDLLILIRRMIAGKGGTHGDRYRKRRGNVQIQY